MAYPILRSSTESPLIFFLVQSSDHITGLTGASPTVTISKNGGAFASPSGAVTEIANGWYKVAGNATDTGTLGPIALHATATSGDPCDIVVAYVTTCDPQTNIAQTGDAYGRLGAPAGASIAADIAEIEGETDTLIAGVTVTTNNDKTGYSLASPPGIRKNSALNNFMFQMRDSTTHAPKTGVTVTVTRSIDGGAFAAGTLSAVTEVSSGWYAVNFAAADLNGTIIAFRATGASSDDTNILIHTDP